MQTFTSDTGRSFRLLDIAAMEANIGTTIGQNIRHLRRLKKQTQAQLAEQMNMSVSQLKKYEKGEEIPRMHHACRLSILTGMAPLYLLKNSEYEKYFPDFFFDDDVLHCADALMHTPSTDIGLLFALLSQTQEVSYFDPHPLDRAAIPTMLGDLEGKYYVDLSSNMRPWRQAAGLSKEQMAMLLNLSLSTIHEYERPSEQRRFSVLIAARFGAVTGDDPADMTKNSVYECFRRVQLARLARCYKILQKQPNTERTCSVSWLQSWQRVCTSRHLNS
ncbi:helix-turn-helix domain-containing protein [Salinibius halmophilus]|uniref:helix-turn-helix domain-containing protein n=1 Tax=Salinibius halmophilus TaxID=1853216 RepID=UPI000E65EEFF|nr:helix-turn-helix transcriptional regulator [Salinibius halmophilus]